MRRWTLKDHLDTCEPNLGSHVVRNQKRKQHSVYLSHTRPGLGMLVWELVMGCSEETCISMEPPLGPNSNSATSSFTS